MRTFTSLLLLPAIVPTLLLGACAKKIPVVDDPHKIVVDGRSMTASEFAKRYCQGEVLHPSCVIVTRSIVADASHGPMPKGW